LSDGKSERLLNLTICLLMARHFISKQDVRRTIEGYRGLDDAAFNRLFERDKDELRELGVPLSVGSDDPLFPDDVGYRILRKDFELPPLSFEPAELAVLGLASSVWDAATQADEAKSALAKLRAAGADPDPGRMACLAPNLSAKEPAFAAMWQAMLDRVEVSFDYHGKRRSYQPWAMTHRQGAWYVYGRDLGVGQPRIYRLGRVESDVEAVSGKGAFEPPEVDFEALLAQIEPKGPEGAAVVAIRGEEAGPLRRSGTPVDAPAPPGYSAYRISYAGDVVAELASHGAGVLVLDPPQLRQAVVDHLAAMAGEGER
jgi:proteasome accessory factor B